MQKDRTTCDSFASVVELKIGAIACRVFVSILRIADTAGRVELRVA